MENMRQRNWMNRLIIILLILFVVYMVVQLAPLLTPIGSVLKALLLPVGLSALLTYFLHPLVEKIHEAGLSRGVAVLLIFVAIIFSIGFLLTIGLPALIKQIQHAFEQIPAQLRGLELMSVRIQEQVNSLPKPIQSHTKEWTVQLGQASEQALDQLEKVAFFLLQSIFSFMVIPFLVFYFLKDYSLIQKAAWYVTPRKWRKSLQRYVKDVDHTFGSFIRGQLLVSLSVAIISMVGLWVIGVPYPILLGLFIGAADLIPYFGAFIGAIPAVVVALLESWQLGLFATIFIVVLQQIEGNLLSPLIVGKTLHLHPMLIIIALLVGIETGGVIGLLVAVPALAIGKVTLLHLRLHLMND